MTKFLISDRFEISGMQIGMIQNYLYMIVTDDNEGEIVQIFDIIDKIVTEKKLEVTV